MTFVAVPFLNLHQGKTPQQLCPTGSCDITAEHIKEAKDEIEAYNERLMKEYEDMENDPDWVDDDEF
mgnify:CR=1 FL=1